MTYQFRLRDEPFEFYPEFDDAEESDFAETWEGEVPPNCPGDRYVCWLQESLNTILNLRLKVDGDGGRNTRSAVRSFQSKKGLKPRADGVVCPDTEQALIAAGANPPPGTAQATGHETPPEQTVYVDIPLQIPLGKAKSMTGIFVPQGFCPLPQVDLIVYLHGDKLRSHQPHFSIDTYWHLPEFLLREEVNKSQKNVILVAPTLGPKSEAGSLACPGGFNKFLEQVMMALKQHGPYAGVQKAPSIGNIILACHSGSGGVMRAIAMGTDTSATKIQECWAFEPFNMGDAGGWANWAQSHRKLYIYFLPGHPGQQLDRNLMGVRNLPKPNVVAERSTAGHDDVPRSHLKDRIQGAQFLAAKSPCTSSKTGKAPSAIRHIFREATIPASEFYFEWESTDPITGRAGEFGTELDEFTSDEKAQSSANAARRAARESYDAYKKDCKGVDLVRGFTREPSDYITKYARLKKRVEQVPELFRKIRLEDEKLKEDLKHARSEGQRESLRKQHRIRMARLLDQAGFDPRVKWTEESALAQARCELSEFNWIHYSFCEGKEVETPGRFARAVAEHYVRTETGLSLNGQTARCEVHSVFCDVRFPNEIVVRVNFSNIPDYFTAVQIAPRPGPKREYRYSCFRGQINLSPNQDALPAAGWPYQRRFSPAAQTIPAGPYQTRPTCEDLRVDLAELQSVNDAFSRSVELLDKLVKQKPRNESLFKETAERAKKQQATLKIILEKMINRTRSGWYLRGGCSHKDIARVTCKIRKLPGVWLRTPPIQRIKKLRDQLVFRLRHSSGAFKNVLCERL